jgi:hypothetical protein
MAITNRQALLDRTKQFLPKKYTDLVFDQTIFEVISRLPILLEEGTLGSQSNQATKPYPWQDKPDYHLIYFASSAKDALISQLQAAVNQYDLSDSLSCKFYIFDDSKRTEQRLIVEEAGTLIVILNNHPVFRHKQSKLITAIERKDEPFDKAALTQPTINQLMQNIQSESLQYSLKRLLEFYTAYFQKLKVNIGENGDEVFHARIDSLVKQFSCAYAIKGQWPLALGIAGENCVYETKAIAEKDSRTNIMKTNLALESWPHIVLTRLLQEMRYDLENDIRIGNWVLRNTVYPLYIYVSTPHFARTTAQFDFSFCCHVLNQMINLLDQLEAATTPSQNLVTQLNEMLSQKTPLCSHLEEFELDELIEHDELGNDKCDFVYTLQEAIPTFFDALQERATALSLQPPSGT